MHGVLGGKADTALAPSLDVVGTQEAAECFGTLAVLPLTQLLGVGPARPTLAGRLGDVALSSLLSPTRIICQEVFLSNSQMWL